MTDIYLRSGDGGLTLRDPTQADAPVEPPPTPNGQFPRRGSGSRGRGRRG